MRLPRHPTPSPAGTHVRAPSRPGAEQLRVLKRLSDLEVSGHCVNFALLKSTMIGNAVGKLRKSEYEEVREKADEIVRKWKVQLGEEERRSAPAP